MTLCNPLFAPPAEFDISKLTPAQRREREKALAEIQGDAFAAEHRCDVTGSLFHRDDESAFDYRGRTAQSLTV
jgi:hypothetical protein